jgi:hypothetical protein
VIPEANRRQLSEQQRAVQRLRLGANPYLFRVQADAEGFPVIPGRYGKISVSARRDVCRLRKPFLIHAHLTVVLREPTGAPERECLRDR